MQVTVTGRHFDVTPALRAYLDVRLARMHRYLSDIQSAHVMLSSEKHRNRAEVVLHANGKEFTGKDDATDMFSAIDRVAQKLDKQLRRHKDRRTSARKNAGKPAVNGDGQAYQGTLRVLRAASVGRGAELHELITAADYDIETMNVDEAVAALDATQREFLVFANRSTSSFHVVYRLPEGDYGVLDLHASA